MKKQIIGHLGEYTTPAGDRVIERWLPRGSYRRSPRDIVDVPLDALLWIFPDTKEYWAAGVEPEDPIRQRGGAPVWNVSVGRAEFKPDDPDDRGPWFSKGADMYEEVLATEAGLVTKQLPIGLAMAAYYLIPRMLYWQKKMPKSQRRAKR